MRTWMLALWLTAAPAAASDLLDPPEERAPAPEAYKVRFETTAGPFTVLVVRDWAPNAADRFYELVQLDFYDDAAFFRVIDGFVAQFGVHPDPQVAAAWRRAKLPDDPVLQHNRKKWLSFASAGPDSRTTQVFVNLANNRSLDEHGFAPFAKVTSGWSTVKALYSAYGEGAPRGAGPDQIRLQDEGNAYLKANFPRIDYVIDAEIAD